jgi:tellurite methyltransferase
LMTALKPQGLLFYQTFNQSKLDEKGPSKPEFLLSRNELRETFADLHLLYYREDGRVGDLSNGRRNCSYFIGQKS